MSRTRVIATEHVDAAGLCFGTKKVCARLRDNRRSERIIDGLAGRDVEGVPNVLAVRLGTAQRAR